MALPNTGPLSASDVNVELSKASTALISLNDADVRALAGVPSGTISFQNLRGKSALSVSATDVSGTAAAFASSGPVASDNTSTTVTGGTAPFTFSWTYLSGSSVPQVSSSTAQNPNWFNNDTPEGSNSAVWRVTVTDANSNTATDDINVTLIFINLN